MVCGQPALFSNERLTESDIPEGTLCYDLRESDTSDGFATIEPHVRVNHGGSVIVNEPIDFGKDGFIAFTDDTSPNFLGEKLTFRQFLDGDFEQKGDVNLIVNTLDEDYLDSLVDGTDFFDEGCPHCDGIDDCPAHIGDCENCPYYCCICDECVYDEENE